MTWTRPRCVTDLIALQDSSVEKALMSIPSLSAHLLQTREATFRLSPKDRTRLSSWLDVDALEEVLAWLKPEFRNQALEDMQVLAAANAATVQIIPLGESNPEWAAAPEALKSAVRRLSELPNRTPR